MLEELNSNLKSKAEMKECKEGLFFLQAIANEKCRVTSGFTVMGSGPIGSQLYPREECRSASKQVLEQIEKCQGLRKKN